ncbi:MAG: chromosome segregation protein SMC [Bacteroidia bacterium]|nr:chromosome segregation protein SMC [Bacteroidia bacterium]
MFLKSLEIYGFKSFADRTKLTFDRGVSGIVGPNGCGKSNVIDSIRWVLGEQKTKNLRSDKMENVIFNGTDKRKKANFCEVSITFENHKNLLPPEYTTVTITRRLYRDGESEYYLNNVLCRLKDITTLFMDTGIGSDSYAIIELGMVDDLLNDKNNSRRELFEEAAGISKYKVRKRDTLKRLDDTQQDLSRIEDLLFEIEKNLKVLEKQAKKAEKYFELKKQYKLASSQVAFLKNRILEEKLSVQHKLEQEFNDKIVGCNTRIGKHDARISELQKDVLYQEDILSSERKRFQEFIEQIREIEQQKTIRAESLKFIGQREITIHEQIHKDQQNLDSMKAIFVELEEKIDQANEQYDKSEFLVAELETEQEELKSLVQKQKLLTEELQQKIRAKENRVNQLSRERDLKTIQLDGLQKELERAQNDQIAKNHDLDSFSEKIRILNDEINLEKTNLSKMLAFREQLLKDLQILNEQLVRQKEQIYATQRQIDAKQNEYNLTKSLVESLEGFPESVKFLKKQKNWSNQAVLLSDIFTINEDYRVALEYFLEPLMNYFVVPTRLDAIQAVDILAKAGKGKANFLIQDELPQLPTLENINLPETAIPALQLLEYSPEYQRLATYLFQTVVFCESIPVNVPEPWIFVEKKGTSASSRAYLRGGSIGLFEGKRIGRAKNLEKLELEVRQLTEQLENEKSKQIELQESIRKLNADNPTHQIEAAQKVLTKKELDLSALQAKQEQFKAFLKQAQNRTEDLVQEIEKITASIQSIDPELEKAEVELDELNKQFKEKTQAYLEYSNQYSEISNRLNQENLTFVQIKNQIDNLKKEFRFKREQQTQLRQSIEKLNQELAELAHKRKELEETNTTNDDQLIKLYQEKEEFEKRLQFSEEKLRSFKNQVIQNENFIKEERKQKEEIEKQRLEVRDAIQELRFQKNAISDRMKTEFEIDIEHLKSEELFAEKEATNNIAELEKELIRLRERLQTYGEVNPMAVESYQEVKERYDFIVSQKTDLEKAKQDLLNTIHDIDQTAQEKFMSAFTAIRENFIRVFRSLFTEQDTCDLVLVNSDDPTESPIDIIARPKGKRPLTINQLSGGEKTLTAISLLFAIYLFKPAPFCIFDEVDAPLDDANIDKFNKIIQQFSKDSQFIIVTHNKRTMASTEMIYGVTMEETGVSRLLPVDLVSLNLT